MARLLEVAEPLAVLPRLLFDFGNPPFDRRPAIVSFRILVDRTTGRPFTEPSSLLNQLALGGRLDLFLVRLRSPRTRRPPARRRPGGRGRGHRPRGSPGRDRGRAARSRRRRRRSSSPGAGDRDDEILPGDPGVEEREGGSRRSLTRSRRSSARRRAGPQARRCRCAAPGSRARGRLSRPSPPMRRSIRWVSSASTPTTSQRSRLDTSLPVHPRDQPVADRELLAADLTHRPAEATILAQQLDGRAGLARRRREPAGRSSPRPRRREAAVPIEG